MTVISIQSQVAYGHVGNSAAVFPLQMHGIDVIAVPTTLLSNRPGYPTLRGRVLDAELVADLLLGIEERGAVNNCRMILSGYLGSAEIAAVVADFVARARARNPSLLYCCDPVLGDRDRGFFVQAAIPPLVRDRLCPLADILTPNHFEFEYLVGAQATTKAATSGEVIAQAQTLLARGPSTVVITSTELSDTPDGEIETLAVEQSQSWRVRTPRLPISPPGPATCLPRCLLPRAFRARTRGTRSATPLPPSSPCWSARRSAGRRKCASSRTPNNSFARHAGSMPSLSGHSVRDGWSGSDTRQLLPNLPRQANQQIVSSPFAKNILPSLPTQITCINLAVSSHWRGGSRSSRTRDGMRWTRAMSKDE
jgi:pyridoxine kinase